MTATVARLSHGDRTGDASGNTCVGAVDSRKQMQHLKFKVLAETNDGEQVILKYRIGSLVKEVSMRPEPTPSQSTGRTYWQTEPVAFPVDQNIFYYYCIAGSEQLVDSQPRMQRVQRDARGLVKLIEDGAFKYKEQGRRQRHSPAPAAAPAAAPVPASALTGQQASERFEARFEAEFEARLATRFEARLEAELAKLRAEAITRENIGELLTAYVLCGEHRTQAAEAGDRMAGLEKIIQGQHVGMGELKTQAEDLRLKVGELKTWSCQSAPKQTEMQRRQQEQAQSIQGLQVKMGELKLWKEQSVTGQAELQKMLQEEQAHAKQVDDFMKSQQSGLDYCHCSLRRLQEEAQNYRQETGDRLMFNEELQNQRLHVDSEATRLADLVGQLKDGLQETQQEISQGLQVEVGELKACQDHSLRVQAEMQTRLQEGQTHAKQLDQVVASLGLGQQTASSELATLAEDLQRLQGLQEDGRQQNSATLVKLSEDLQGLQGLQEEGQQKSSATLAKLSEEMDEHAKTLRKQLQSQREEVDSEAARLAGLVGQLEGGLQRAQEDHTASATQLATLQANMVQQQQCAEEGALAAGRLATELKALQDNTEGLRRLQSLVEQRRQEICSLRRDVVDLQDGVGDVQDQMQVLSTVPAGTGATDTGVSTRTQSTPLQSDDASVTTMMPLSQAPRRV